MVKKLLLLSLTVVCSNYLHSEKFAEFYSDFIISTHCAQAEGLLDFIKQLVNPSDLKLLESEIEIQKIRGSLSQCFIKNLESIPVEILQIIYLSSLVDFISINQANIMRIIDQKLPKLLPSGHTNRQRLEFDNLCRSITDLQTEESEPELDSLRRTASYRFLPGRKARNPKVSSISSSGLSPLEDGPLTTSLSPDVRGRTSGHSPLFR